MWWERQLTMETNMKMSEWPKKNAKVKLKDVKHSNKRNLHTDLPPFLTWQSHTCVNMILTKVHVIPHSNLLCCVLIQLVGLFMESARVLDKRSAPTFCFGTVPVDLPSMSADCKVGTAEPEMLQRHPLHHCCHGNWKRQELLLCKTLSYPSQ
jgi:hypothetical protein